MDSTPPPKLRIAIVGGGIGGLALAVALSCLGADAELDIDVYESAAELTQVGAGISFWPRGWDVLAALGLADDLAAALPPGQAPPTRDKTRQGVLYKKSDRAHAPDARIAALAFPGGSVSFHRADVLRVLRAHLSPRVRVHLGRRLAAHRVLPASPSPSAPGAGVEVELAFTDGGPRAHCDMLVGADGIHSAVRRGFLRDECGLGEDKAARAVWTGTTVYRSVIDAARVAQRDAAHPALTGPVAYCGKNKHVIAYPISAGKTINAVAFFTDPARENTLLDGPSVVPQTTDNVTALYAAWSDETRCITDNMVNPSRWAIEMVAPLDKYGAGRVVLLGDAAHAMPPHLGNGAGQAFEDAYILAHLLSASTTHPTSIPDLIAVYTSIRQPFANFVAQASVAAGKHYEFATPAFVDVRAGDAVGADRLAGLGEEITQLTRWTWETSVASDLERALAML